MSVAGWPIANVIGSTPVCGRGKHHARRFPTFGLACGLLLALGSALYSARIQSDAELDTLYDRLIVLHRAGQYRDAIPIAEDYITASRKRHGKEDPTYTTAIS